MSFKNQYIKVLQANNWYQNNYISISQCHLFINNAIQGLIVFINSLI